MAPAWKRVFASSSAWAADRLAAAAETLWVDAFVIRRFPVTNREYLAYLNDLVASGREDLAVKYAPRERGGTSEEGGAMIYGRDANGRFFLRPDADGDAWEPDAPVCMVD